MIKYNLKCNNNHEFESWFSDSSEFDKLKKKGLLDCIFCNSTRIEKTLMTPNIQSSKNKNEFLIDDKKRKYVKKKLKDYQKFIKENFDYVGDNFSYKARLLHYKKNKN